MHVVELCYDAKASAKANTGESNVKWNEGALTRFAAEIAVLLFQTTLPRN